jgi:DNA-binding response OmpR family regulator
MAPRVLIVDDNAELLGLLATVFEDAGYQVVQSLRGRPALERIQNDRPDIAVIDVLLPDVIGYEVAAKLKQQQIPFVFMTGVFKGGRHSLDAGTRYGASGYFEKPFDIETLVEKIASIVPPTPRTSPATIPPGSVDLRSEIDMRVDVDPEEGTQPRDISLTGRVRVTEAASKVSATLSGEALRFDSRLPNGPDSVPPQRASAPRFNPPVMGPVVGPVSTPGGTKPVSSPSRLGQLKDNLPQLISAFYLAQETGELVVQRGQVRKVVYFEKGVPVFAVSNLATDRFGQFLVRTGKVQSDECQAAAKVAEMTGRRTGDVLIEMGLLTETERMYYIGQQVKAILYGLFAWEEGNWLLSFKRRARAETLKLDSHPANLIMRGVKKLYSPARLIRLLPDESVLIPAQDPSYLLSDVELEGWEAMLLARVDGTRTAKALIELAKRPPEQVRGLLVGLMSLRVLNVAK